MLYHPTELALTPRNFTSMTSAYWRQFVLPIFIRLDNERHLQVSDFKVDSYVRQNSTFYCDVLLKTAKLFGLHGKLSKRTRDTKIWLFGANALFEPFEHYRLSLEEFISSELNAAVTGHDKGRVLAAVSGKLDECYLNLLGFGHSERPYFRMRLHYYQTELPF